jgi:hypothetical protein
MPAWTPFFKRRSTLVMRGRLYASARCSVSASRSDAIRQRYSRAIGRICSTRITAKPRSVFLHNGLKSMHSTECFSLIIHPRNQSGASACH